jgi:hypothetical protein
MVRDFQPARRIKSFSPPALGEPLVGEGVPELMGVQAGSTGLLISAPEHELPDRPGHGWPPALSRGRREGDPP